MDNKKIRFSTDVYWSVGVWVAMSLFMLTDRWFAFLPAEADWVYVSCMSLSLLTAFDVYRCYKAAQKGGCRIATAVDLPWALVLLAGVLWLSVSAQISALRQIEVAGLLDMVCLVLNLWFILGLMGKRRYATGDGDAATVDAFEYTLPAGRSSALSAVRKALSYIEYFSLVVFLAVLGYVLMEKGNIVVAAVVFVLALVVLVVEIKMCLPSNSTATRIGYCRPLGNPALDVMCIGLGIATAAVGPMWLGAMLLVFFVADLLLWAVVRWKIVKRCGYIWNKCNKVSR